MALKHGSLFNGIGGFQLAAYWMGWENVFSVEIDDFCNSITKKHFPNCIQHGDIKQTGFKEYSGRIDILSGGDPCQPSSIAGLRKGKNDERYLWPEYFRAVKIINPKVVVNENVTGTISNGILDTKIIDLESIGYACWPPLIISASSKDAPHKRNRVWLIAYAECARLQGYNTKWQDLCSNKTASFPQHSNTDVFKGCELVRGYSTYIRSGNGLSRKLDKQRVKALGNAIVPQIAFEIFKHIGNSLQ